MDGGDASVTEPVDSPAVGVVVVMVVVIPDSAPAVPAWDVDGLIVESGDAVDVGVPSTADGSEGGRSFDLAQPTAQRALARNRYRIFIGYLPKFVERS